MRTQQPFWFFLSSIADNHLALKPWIKTQNEKQGTESCGKPENLILVYSILKYLLNNPVIHCHYDDLLLSLYRAVVRSDINLRAFASDPSRTDQ